ncbi:MAG: quinone oxidoreductase [Acidimicrobiia bacterium]
MRAIVVSELGDADKLVVAEIAEPGPGAGELLVEVDAAGLNFIDTYHRTGLYRLDLPFTPGLEGAGTVLELGEGVTGFEVGDTVGWVDTLGSYAEQHVIPAESAIPIPSSVDTGVAAASLLQGITAHYLATDTYPLSPGDKCLIHAGAGGVGLLLTQIAKIRGATVFTTVGTEDKAELSRAAGADHVIVYTQSSFRSAIEELSGPKSMSVVYDGVGADTFLEGLDVLAFRGMMVTFGNASGPVPEISPLILAQKGSLFLTRPTIAHYTRSREEVLARTGQLFDWIEAGMLKVRIGAEFPLEEAAGAHRALEGRKTTGKVLIRP